MQGGASAKMSLNSFMQQIFAAALDFIDPAVASKSLKAVSPALRPELAASQREANASELHPSCSAEPGSCIDSSENPDALLDDAIGDQGLPAHHEAGCSRRAVAPRGNRAKARPARFLSSQDAQRRSRLLRPSPLPQRALHHQGASKGSGPAAQQGVPLQQVLACAAQHDKASETLSPGLKPSDASIWPLPQAPAPAGHDKAGTAQADLHFGHASSAHNIRGPAESPCPQHVTSSHFGAHLSAIDAPSCSRPESACTRLLSSNASEQTGQPVAGLPASFGHTAGSDLSARLQELASQCSGASVSSDASAITGPFRHMPLTSLPHEHILQPLLNFSLQAGRLGSANAFKDELEGLVSSCSVASNDDGESGMRGDGPTRADGIHQCQPSQFVRALGTAPAVPSATGPIAGNNSEDFSHQDADLWDMLEGLPEMPAEDPGEQMRQQQPSPGPPAGAAFADLETSHSHDSHPAPAAAGLRPALSEPVHDSRPQCTVDLSADSHPAACGQWGTARQAQSEPSRGGKIHQEHPCEGIQRHSTLQIGIASLPGGADAALAPSCRPDVVEPPPIRVLQMGGLFAAYAACAAQPCRPKVSRPPQRCMHIH